MTGKGRNREDAYKVFSSASYQVGRENSTFGASGKMSGVRGKLGSANQNRGKGNKLLLQDVAENLADDTKQFQG